MAKEKKLMSELERMSAEEFRQSEKIPIVIVLDDVRSMHNVGSVFRTADCFRAEKVCLCGYTPAPPHRDIQKTALGATETVTWQHYRSAEDCLAELKDSGYVLLAVEQVHGSIPLHTYEVKKGRKLALVFGNEVAGVRSSLLPLCDHALEIPQLGSKHSLNISVSAGIVLWHFVKNYLVFL